MQRGTIHAKPNVDSSSGCHKTFKKALIGEEPGSLQKGLESHFIRFSYVERATKEWLGWSNVGKCRKKLDLHRIQEEARNSRMSFIVFPVEKIYCLISFQNVGSINRLLSIRTSWFDDRSLNIFLWDSSDLVSSSMYLVRLKCVLLSL